MIGSGRSESKEPLVKARTPILVLNGGSSSIKFSVFDAMTSLSPLYEGEASGIGTPKARFDFFAIHEGQRQSQDTEQKPHALDSFREAVQRIAASLDQPGVPRPLAIGHRVVHSGPKLHAHQRITPAVLADIEQAVSFAPLHQPIALEILHRAMQIFPDVPHYACFDTVFHQTMPEEASIYPLPAEIREQGVHRYGFHGLSFESILQQFLDGRVPGQDSSFKVPARMIVAHLGSGASITAVRDGKSIDTTMGLTPCGGVVMGTRPGDLDPGLIFYLLRRQTGDSASATDAIEQMLNKRSGLLALSEISNDMRIVRDAAAKGNPQAALAIEVFVRSIKKVIGGYVALLGGVDALVFTGGIGEHDALSRTQICAGLNAFGIVIDPQKNEATQPRARCISQQESRTAVYVLPAEEDQRIAAHVAQMVSADQTVSAESAHR